jgi:3-hydroxymyristoyl/3-hydroxydecanoyl-(acyl carrier protein) dehydratase
VSPAAEIFESVEIEDATARALVRRAHAHDLARGHFPGDPLLPGAYLVALMAEVAERLLADHLRRPVAVTEVAFCIFGSPVRPDDEIVVSARRGDGAGLTADAEVSVEGRRAAHGRFHLR